MELVVAARYGEDWAEIFTQDSDLIAYGRSSGFAVPPQATLRVCIEDIYYLIGIGELEASFVFEMFNFFHANFAEKVREGKIKKMRSWQLHFRAKAHNRPGVLAHLTTPWEQLGINIEKEGGTLPDQEDGNATIVDISLRVDTKLQEIQIRKQLALLASLEEIIFLGIVEGDNMGSETVSRVFKTQQ